MILPFFVSFSSIGCISSRSPSGFTLTAAIIYLLLLFFWFEAATVDLATVAGKLFSLLLLVFVHDFEFCIDNVAVTSAAALTCALFRARARASFGSWLRTGSSLR